jgi:molybdate transport system ATP-binding protein
VAGERIDLLADGSGDENLLRCRIGELLSLGETSLCVLQPELLPGERVTLTLASGQLRALDVAAGSWVRLAIPPEAVHIMPQKEGAATAAPGRDQAM